MRDGINRLQLRRYGKLKSTHPCKLQLPHLVYCLCTAAAAVYEPQCTRYYLSLVYCGSCTAGAIYFFIPRVLWRLVYCGGAAI